VKRGVIIAGFGGQGLLFAGKVLAYAAMLEGLEVTWLPSYGPQMRGGTANCTVVVSDRPVRSPIVRHPTDVITLNRPSLEAFEPLLQAGGVMIINSSLVDPRPSRSDLSVYEVPASQIAERLGALRVANLVALGRFVGVTHLISPASIHEALEKVIPDSRADLRALNMAAFDEGMVFTEQHQPQRWPRPGMEETGPRARDP
jgi:2-oxoglutarate ferredoxin oxidoreductase subunit gamma